MNAYDVLKERGFVEQISDESAVRNLLETPITCYIGFDPTCDSFHTGSLIPIMALAHMQRHGHRVIALVGGGTAMIGDPSGKTEMRKLLTKVRIDENARGLRKQLEKYLDFSAGRALMLDNAEWLLSLNYIDFLREIGRHFSVNRMLAAETYRQRLESGLNFIEFNYILLQSYDYLYLYRKYSCQLQMGGNDQWGNILAGADLIRRLEQGQAEALTFPLLTTATGEKMGKTEQGALFLDAERTEPYQYYQYWINCDDRDVVRFLKLFTFLTIDEIGRYEKLQGAELREAKEVLAFEATRLNHGEEEARKAQAAARSLFSGAGGVDESAIPTHEVDRTRLTEGIPAFVLFAETKMAKSRGEARRLIAQGGAYVNARRLEVFDENITDGDVQDGFILLRTGKKKYLRVKPVDR
jgi:tyrosyl-tRNA synthetase